MCFRGRESQGDPAKPSSWSLIMRRSWYELGIPPPPNPHPSTWLVLKVHKATTFNMNTLIASPAMKSPLHHFISPLFLPLSPTFSSPCLRQRRNTLCPLRPPTHPLRSLPPPPPLCRAAARTHGSRACLPLTLHTSHSTTLSRFKPHTSVMIT